MGARPSSKAIQRWHSEHAEEVWGDAAVSYQEVQRHANRMRCKRSAHEGGPQDVDDAETSEPEDEPGSTPERERHTSASAPAPSGRALSRDPSYSLLLHPPRGAGAGGGQRRNGVAFYSGPTGAGGGAAGARGGGAAAYGHDSVDLGYGLGLGQLGALPPGALTSGQAQQLHHLGGGHLLPDGADAALPLHALPFGVGAAGVSASLLGQLAAAAAASGGGERYAYGDGSEAWQDQVDADEAEAASRLMALNPAHRSTGSIGNNRVLHLPAVRAISLDGPGGACAAVGRGDGGIGFVGSSTPPPLPREQQQRLLLQAALNGGGGIGLVGEELAFEDEGSDAYAHAGPYRLQAAAALGGGLDEQQQQQQHESLLALQAHVLQQQGLTGRALSATGLAAAAAAVAQQQRLASFRVKRQRGEADVDMQEVHAVGSLGLQLQLQQQQHSAMSGLGALRLGGLALRPLKEADAAAEADDEAVVVDMMDGPVGGGGGGGGGGAEWGRPPNRKTARLGASGGGNGGSASTGGGVPADLQLQLQLLMLRQRQQQQNESGAVAMQVAGGGGAAGSPRLDLDLQAEERYVQVRADFGRRSAPSYGDQGADAAAAAARRGGLPPAAAPGLVRLRPRPDSGPRTVLPMSGGAGLEAQSLGGGGGGMGGRMAPAVMLLGGRADGGDAFQQRCNDLVLDRDADAWEQGAFSAAAGRPRAGAPLRGVGGGGAAAVPRAASTGAVGSAALMLPGDVKLESGLDAIAAAAAAVAAAEDRSGAADHAAAADARTQHQLQLRALQQQQAQLTAALRELQEQQLAVEMRQQQQQHMRLQPHESAPPYHRPPLHRGQDDEAEADRAAAAAMLTEERALHSAQPDVEAEERVAGLRSTLLLLLQQRRAAEGAGADGGERGAGRVPQGVSLAPLRTGAAAGGTW
ncbi:hypothetical protein HXX76_007761 [Chlamydomonas incerta]|uniref:Uncharacterized protein n=1 Tax=Chlamydomonas incerta TaxID=51695 RepID=A0A835SVV6_CHLIN|nr:hypothetical protein HXX76_007761 [Chlamydomonas incerta]|eukprot:KAG2434033.1 hypothetical protein HXX76_007761 [Chlamydomonas incerta]